VQEKRTVLRTMTDTSKRQMRIEARSGIAGRYGADLLGLKSTKSGEESENLLPAPAVFRWSSLLSEKRKGKKRQCFRSSILCLNTMSPPSVFRSFFTIIRITAFFVLAQPQSLSSSIQAFCPASAGVGGLLSSAPRTITRTSRRVTQDTAAAAAMEEEDLSTTVVQDRSTLTLLEHVNLNVPSHEFILPFYFRLLGCGMDPRKAANLRPDAAKKTLWANCGASQVHLPYGDVAQRIPGTIGLRFRNWSDFCERVEKEIGRGGNVELSSSSSSSCVKACEKARDRSNREFIRLTDRYDNVFLCRPEEEDSGNRKSNSNIYKWKQPIIAPTDLEEWGSIANDYGRDQTDCAGLEFVEFVCPIGTAKKIALFYDSVLDATTSVVEDGDCSVAMIAFGNVDATGRADQSLLFRETSDEIPPYDGHHVAMYVGETAEDFEQAYKNAEVAGVVWVNPRFSDKADTLQGAREWKQFRFKDIVDMETGEKIFELEHEMRSCEHEAWPGKGQL